MKRRHLLKQTALVGLSGLVATSTHSWLWRSAAGARERSRLIVIFLRGAVDGLSVVVPFQEPDYYTARPSLAIKPPGETDGALDLDGRFGLHPALSPLMPQWKAGRMAFVHGTGSPDNSRSHFQAQDYIEKGGPDDLAVTDGWLNRLLAVLPGGTPTQAVSIGERMPLIFRGPQSVATMASQNRRNPALQIDRPEMQTAFDRLYQGNSHLARVYQEGRAARDILLQELAAEMEAASQGGLPPGDFAANAHYLAELMAGEAATQVAFMDLGGWDTHVNQKGTLNHNLEALGSGLSTLIEALGPAYAETTIAVVSEFGRTLAENGNGGTEHGHGNVLWLMGGSLRGAQFYGQWPGLAPDALHESRDLAVTTDFRDVLGALLAQQFGLDQGAIAQIFPGYQPQRRFEFL